VDSSDFAIGDAGTLYLTGPTDFKLGRPNPTRRAAKAGAFCEKGDVLVVVKGSGTGAAFKSDNRYAIGRQLMAVRATSWHQDFVYHVLASNYDRYQAQATGLIPGISREHILNTRFHSLSNSEQRKIADILSTWDEALEKLDALIAAKDRRKQSLMQQLLTGRKRVKGAKGKWKKMQLGDLAGNQSDQNKGKLGTECLYGVTKADGVVPMREHVKGESFHRCKMLEHDWFAYNPMRINIGSIARWQGNKRIMVSGDYVVFRCFEERLSPAYLDQLRKSWMWQSFVTRGGNGSVRIRIYFSDLAEFTFPCPPIEEQRQIAAILDTADHELTLLRAQRNALDQQKRGLMQRLLTGKVRVKPN
jgi:type I restriction enzyme S subunit